MPRLRKLTTLLVAVVGVIATACANTPSSPSTSAAPTTASSPVAQSTPIAHAPDGVVLNVVTTNNIVSDWAKNVGGDRVKVFSLMPVNADPHTFQPGARDVTRVAEADLVFSVGLALEATWFQELVENAASDTSKVVALGELVDPIEFVETGAHGHDEHEDNEDDQHGEFDPHFWFDPIRVKLAVNDIASRLSVMDSEGADIYRANAKAYNERLDELHEWIQQQVSQVPQDRRLLVTSHNSLGYFAQAYDFKIIGAVIPGGTTERDPSAQEIAALIETVRDSNAPAIFTEATVSDRLAQRIAEETGVKVRTELFTGSLGGPGSGAETYIDFMRNNVERIVEALK